MFKTPKINLGHQKSQEKRVSKEKKSFKKLKFIPLKLEIGQFKAEVNLFFPHFSHI